MSVVGEDAVTRYAERFEREELGFFLESGLDHSAYAPLGAEGLESCRVLAEFEAEEAALPSM